MSDFVLHAEETDDVIALKGQAPEAGMKGGWEQIIFSVGSGTAAVRMFRLWLKRDRHRSANVKIRSDTGTVTEIIVDGQGLSIEALKKAIDMAVKVADSSSD